MLTTSQIINIAKISQYLAIRDITVKGLFGGGVDLRLPNKIYNLRKSIEYWYDLDPTDTSLVPTGRYLLAICGIYGQVAQTITGGSGTVAVINSTSTAPLPLDFIVSASSVLPTGSTGITIAAFVGWNVQFSRNGLEQNTTNVGDGSSYFGYNRTTGTFSISPAANEGELFRITPV